MLSIPTITPLATLGAAPRITTKKIARSLSPKSRMASGNHAMDGIVCSPVISEPIASRRTRTRATATPMTVPTRTAAVNPVRARRRVVDTASQKTGVCR